VGRSPTQCGHGASCSHPEQITTTKQLCAHPHPRRARHARCGRSKSQAQTWKEHKQQTHSGHNHTTARQLFTNLHTQQASAQMRNDAPKARQSSSQNIPAASYVSSIPVSMQHPSRTAQSVRPRLHMYYTPSVAARTCASHSVRARCRLLYIYTLHHYSHYSQRASTTLR